LAYRALTLLYLVLGKDRATPQDVHYFADEQIPASRLFEAKGFSGGDGPEGRTVVGFDLACTVGDATWNASADELVTRIRPALERTGVTKAEVLSVHVRRMPAAYPLYRKGFARVRDQALEALSRVEGLYPVGRHALFVHDNVHHACAAGLAVGKAVAKGRSAREWRTLQAPFLHAQIED
jgi:protoporphyrinogen oxidase